MAPMHFEFADDDLHRLYTERGFTGELDLALVKAFRKRVGQISEAPDERTFYALKSMHFEKLEGKRAGQHSMKLNDQYRLIVELVGLGKGKSVRIIEITDYH